MDKEAVHTANMHRCLFSFDLLSLDDHHLVDSCDSFTYIVQRCVTGSLANPIDGLVPDCSNSGALAMKLLQSCTKPSLWSSQPHELTSYFIKQVFSSRNLPTDIFTPWLPPDFMIPYKSYSYPHRYHRQNKPVTTMDFITVYTILDVNVCHIYNVI